jgi:PKD repeat protein
MHEVLAAHRRGLLAACVMGAALSAPLSAHAAWEQTLSRAAQVPAGAGAVPAGQVMSIHVTLNIQNKAALDTLVRNQYTPGNPQYGRYLSPAQFTAQFAPGAAQAQKVMDYLRSMGFSQVSLSASRLLVNATGTAAQVEKAFNTRLVQYQKDGRTVRANLSDMQVPAALDGLVMAVIGPNNSPGYQTALERQRAGRVFPPLTARASRRLALAHGSAAAAAVTPAIITAFPPTAWDVAYDAAGTPDGSQSAIAISTFGSEDVEVVNDLRQMERQYGLPYVPVEVRETSAFSTPTPSSSGDDEWDLDTQSSTAMAHNVKKLIIYATENTTDLVQQYDEFATRADAIAGNMSYGTCELIDFTGLLLPDIASSDAQFERAAAEGLSWHASTGDDGGVCSPINALGAPLAGVPLIANYPDSSPFVVAVGGTSLFTDNSFNYGLETAWTSGGGGISLLEGAPTWQQGIVPSASLTSIPGLNLPSILIGSGTGVGRGVPDISLDAGIYLPEAAIAAAADTIVGGTHYAVVGTSLSSPLAVGTWARFQSAHCNTLGFAAPAYYALDQSGGLGSTATGFHDVTLGTNGDYFATTGWDYTTGFGSPDLAAVNAALPAAAGCVAAPTPPLAGLKLGNATGPAPLSVSFDTSGSHDPKGDTLEYYTIDYGDDTLPLQQTTAAFAPHRYAAPGVYQASLTVRNAHGAVSAPAQQTVTVSGTPAACAVPGKTIMTSPVGSSSIPLPVPIVGGLLPPVPDPLPGQDLLSVSVAEPATLPGKLVFTLKVDTLSPAPTPLTRWAVFFTIPNDLHTYYVAMATDSGTPTFVYGTRGSLGGVKISVLGLLTLYNDLGTLDPASNFSADGTIALVLDKSTLGLKTGDTLQGLLSTSAILIQLPPTATGASTMLTVGETVDATGTRFGYQLIGGACGTGSGSSSSGGSSSSSSSSSSSGGSSSGSGSSSSGGSSSSSSGGGSSSSSSSSSGGHSSSSSSGGGGSSSSSGSSSSGSSSGSGSSSSSSGSSSSSSSSGGHSSSSGSSSSSSGGHSSSGGSSSGSSSGGHSSSSSSSSGGGHSSSGGSGGGGSGSGGGGGGGGSVGGAVLLPLLLGAALRRRRRDG